MSHQIDTITLRNEQLRSHDRHPKLQTCTHEHTQGHTSQDRLHKYPQPMYLLQEQEGKVYISIPPLLVLDDVGLKVEAFKKGAQKSCSFGTLVHIIKP